MIKQVEPLPQRPSLRPLRLLYLGMPGEFSRIPLLHLLAAGIDVCGVVAPAGEVVQPVLQLQPQPLVSDLPLLNPYASRTIIHVAWEREIPVLAINRPEAPETKAALGALQPDLACVACFSLRIPASLLTLPPLGFLNLHPSLLPAYRGPAPLFWIFRQGERETGVTVHFMNEGVDTGDIALQAPVEAPDGISGAAADSLYAERGGELLVEAVQRLQNGMLPRQPQPAGGSYYPWPAAADFHISVTWPARRAFNFMRGTAEWNQPYIVEAGEERVALRSAIAYTAGRTLDRPLVRRGRDVWLQFTPGVLQAMER